MNENRLLSILSDLKNGLVDIYKTADLIQKQSSPGLRDVRELIEKHKIKTSEKSSEQFRHDAEIYNSAFDFILKFILQLEHTIQCPKCKTKLIETEEFIDGFPLPYYVFCCPKCEFEISMEELNKLPAPEPDSHKKDVMEKILAKIEERPKARKSRAAKNRAKRIK
jgi:hypothetical protein